MARTKQVATKAKPAEVEKGERKPNRYKRAALLIVDHPDISNADLSKQAIMSEGMAHACIEAWTACLEVLQMKGWLKLPAGYLVAKPVRSSKATAKTKPQAAKQAAAA